jgi:hypothetical protein
MELSCDRCAAHAHARAAFIFARVLKGSIRSAVNQAPARVYREGEAFQERPGDRHSISGNGSVCGLCRPRFRPGHPARRDTLRSTLRSG